MRPDRAGRERAEALGTALAEGAGSTPGFVAGTYRAVPPAETLRRVAPLLPRAGVTRVARISGLDRLGIEVFAAYRPASRTLAVSQGKGMTADAARVSAIMEALELWHSELHQVPIVTASWDQVRRRNRVVDVPFVLRYRPEPPDPHRLVRWTTGLDLLSGTPILVPYEVVHNDDRTPAHRTEGVFVNGTNGLASGNTALEAVLHAVYEVVERDATASDMVAVRPSPLLDLTTVTAASCVELLGRFAAAGIEVLVWDVTGANEVPVYQALGIEVDTPWYQPLPQAWGAGAHRDPSVALSRALTEVAQVRSTLISACRDDLMREDYSVYYDPEARRDTASAGSEHAGVVAFDRHPARPDVGLADDLDWLLKRLAASGVREVAAVDLSLPGTGIAVVKVVIPGLWWRW